MKVHIDYFHLCFFCFLIYFVFSHQALNKSKKAQVSLLIWLLWLPQVSADQLLPLLVWSGSVSDIFKLILFILVVNQCEKFLIFES